MKILSTDDRILNSHKHEYLQMTFVTLQTFKSSPSTILTT